MKTFRNAAPVTAMLFLCACATVDHPPEAIAVAPASAAEAAQALLATTPTLKRKIAVGRFTNSTRYGRALLLPGERDPLAEQAADIVANRLIDSKRFLVFERPDVDAVIDEKALQGDAGGLVGVDALIVGSVTEFGRKAEGRSGFLSSTKRQIATATVEARLVDVHTGLSFFSASGTGEASTESGEVAGFGSQAAFDSSLNDRALSRCYLKHDEQYSWKVGASPLVN